MSFPVHDLEPGGVYEGPGEQQREIISINGSQCVYRVLNHGLCKRRFPAGEVRNMALRHFAEWAWKEVA